MTDIEKIVAVLDTDLSDNLKLELVRLLTGQRNEPAQVQPYVVPIYPQPTYPTYPNLTCCDTDVTLT